MKTLGEIIDAVRDGERPDYEDLRYAICAMDALMTFDRTALIALSEAEDGCQTTEVLPRRFTSSATWQLSENFRRQARAYEKPPKEYVGWNNDPDNPEFLRRRRIAIKLMKGIVEANAAR